jgi:hypothetical protein
VRRSTSAGQACGRRIGQACSRRIFGIGKARGSRVFGIGRLPERTAEPLHFGGPSPVKFACKVNSAWHSGLVHVHEQNTEMEPGAAFALRVATLLLCGAAAVWGVLNEDMKFEGHPEGQQRHVFTSIRAWWRG